MSFVRVEKKPSGSYIRILESYRDESGKVKHRSLHNLGRVEDYSRDQLKRMGMKFYELGGGDVKDLLGVAMEELSRYNYGYQQIYGSAFAHYGLGELFDRLQRKGRLQFSLRDAVFLMLLERLQEPCSKKQNHANRTEYVNLPEVGLHHLYRALDHLSKHSVAVQQQMFSKGRDLFNNKIDVVFYDVTTFYFASEEEKEGELRQMGFGKDGKVGRTQILFSMMIDREGHPVGYRIYRGDSYEGHTFEDALEDLRKRYHIDKVIVVADRGMLSKANIAKTVEKGYDYIIGERARSLPADVQRALLDLSAYRQEWVYPDNQGQKISVRYTALTVGDKTIIGTYSEKRAEKDRRERMEKLEKAEKLLKNPSSLKSKSGRYFIKSRNEAYELDTEKIKRDEMFDGFIAISTNTTIGPTEVLEQYKKLYKIEHGFRTLKSHLEIRPMFHWTDRRIEGHICMCYIAFALQYWVLARAKGKNLALSEKTLRKTLDKMQISLVRSGKEEFYMRSGLNDDQKKLLKALGIRDLQAMIPKNSLQL